MNIGSKVAPYEDIVREIRKEGNRIYRGGYEKVVFTNGCFDILHPGHMRLLEHCRTRSGPAGCVVVGINSDASARRLKGPNRPYMDAEERSTMLVCTRFVDHVVVFDEDTPIRIIKVLRPDLIVKGGDYLAQDVVGRDVASVEIVPLFAGHSSDIVRRIRQS